MDPERQPDPPFLSLCVICGDEGTGTLWRMLESVLIRPSGPMVDEVVIWWNGTADVPPAAAWPLPEGVALRIVRGTWTGDFGTARQASYEAASGIWRMYLDSDDVVPLPGDDAVRREIERSGVALAEVGTAQTLKLYLKALPPDVSAVELPYHYLTADDGAVIQQTWARRIVRWDDGWVWRGAVHEEILPTVANIGVRVQNAGLPILHRPDRPEDSRADRNLKILFRQLAQEEQRGVEDHRTLWGIAASLSDSNRNAESLSYIDRALAAAPPPEPDAVIVYRGLGSRLALQISDLDLAGRHAFEMIKCDPTRPEGYFGLGEVAAHSKNAAQAAYWLTEGFRRPVPTQAYFDDPGIREGYLRVLLAECLMVSGDLDRAATEIQAAMTAHETPYGRMVLRQITDDARRRRIAAAWTTLIDDALEMGDLISALGICDAVPAAIEGSAIWATYRTKVQAREAAVSDARVDPDMGSIFWPRALIHIEAEWRKGDRKDAIEIVVPDSSRRGAIRRSDDSAVWSPDRLHRVLSVCGHVKALAALGGSHPENDPPRIAAEYVPGRRDAHSRVTIFAPLFVSHWGPYTPEEEGCGGTEESIVYMSEALVQQGFDVAVYAPIPPNLRPTHVRNGVLWRSIDRFHGDLPADHLILVRSPQIVGFASLRARAKHVWLWHHDHGYPDGMWNADVAAKVRHIYVSEWQRRILEGQIGTTTRGVVVPHGVPEDQIAAGAAGARRDPFRCVWTSLPYRGLDRLLDYWSEIKRRWPKASLDIFGGLETVSQLWRNARPEWAARIETIAGRVTSGDLPDVRWGGRVGQRTLSEIMWQAGVMPYPTDFPETFGISFLRGAACGMIPVVADRGALAETCPTGAFHVESEIGSVWSDSDRDRFFDRLSEAFSVTDQERMALSAGVLQSCRWYDSAVRLAEALVDPPDDDPRPVPESDFEPEPEPLFVG